MRALDATNVPMMNAWGASGVAMPISKVYDALDKGVVDGVYAAINVLFVPWHVFLKAQVCYRWHECPVSHVLVGNEQESLGGPVEG